MHPQFRTIRPSSLSTLFIFDLFIKKKKFLLRPTPIIVFHVWTLNTSMNSLCVSYPITCHFYHQCAMEVLCTNQMYLNAIAGERWLFSIGPSLSSFLWQICGTVSRRCLARFYSLVVAIATSQWVSLRSYHLLFSRGHAAL